MHDTSARLVERVLPAASYRQWVLTVPFPLRLRIARDPGELGLPAVVGLLSDPVRAAQVRDSFTLHQDSIPDALARSAARDVRLHRTGVQEPAAGIGDTVVASLILGRLTYLFEGSVRYEDSTGKTGVVGEGGVEWFKAAGGAWHGGGPGDTGRPRGFQLWLALPPEQELGPVENIYLEPDAVARDGPAHVLVGTHGGATSSLNPPASLNYLAVRLRAGESWRYQPAIDHTVTTTDDVRDVGPSECPG